MLAKLELKLKCEKELTYQMSSLFHGALMELLPEEYADYLHISKPSSICTAFRMQRRELVLGNYRTE